MKAQFRILSTGETRTIEIVEGFGEFEKLINSHPDYAFIGWISPLAS